MDSTEKREQETASLKKIDDSFKKIVIVRKRIIPKHDNDGILYIGVEEFFLNEAIKNHKTGNKPRNCIT